MRIGLELSKRLVVGVCLVSAACGGGSSNNTNTTPGFWPSAYSSTGAPSTTESAYHATNSTAGQSCMSCHSATSTQATTKLVFGGTVFKADGTTGAGNVQVGVSDGTNKYFVYSAANGQYWQVGTGTENVNWAAADIRIRTGAGEQVKAATDNRNADCDSCHVGADVLKAP